MTIDIDNATNTNTNTKTVTEPETVIEAEAAPAADRPFVEAMLDLGAEWASLGISFGVQALDRSARSLKLASKTLGLVSRKLESSRPRATNG